MELNPDPRSGMSPGVGLMVVGSEMAGFTIVGAVLDYALGSMPWLTVLMTLAGLIVAFIHLWKIVQKKPKPPAPPGP